MYHELHRTQIVLQGEVFFNYFFIIFPELSSPAQNRQLLHFLCTPSIPSTFRLLTWMVHTRSLSTFFLCWQWHIVILNYLTPVLWCLATYPLYKLPPPFPSRFNLLQVPLNPPYHRHHLKRNCPMVKKKVKKSPHFVCFCYPSCSLPTALSFSRSSYNASLFPCTPLAVQT